MATEDLKASDNATTKRSRNQGDLVDLTEDADVGAQIVDLTASDDENSDEDEDQDEDEDEDLKLAIALSLQQQEHPPNRSLLTTTTSTPKVAASSTPETQSSTQPTAISDQSSDGATRSILGLDRKQMEAERLARLKRKRESIGNDRPVSPPPLRRNNLDRVAPTASKLPFHPQQSTSQLGPNDAVPVSNTTAISKPSRSYQDLQYLEGRVMLTSLMKSDDQTTSFADLIKPTSSDAPLKSAFLSTFIVDFDWLFQHFDTRSVSFVLSLHAGSEQEKILIQRDFTGIANVRLVFPYVGGIVNCMHSKVMLLFYENSRDSLQARCRVVIPSANLVPWDWGVGGVMENIAFVVDLPLKSKIASKLEVQDTQFQKSLVHMLNASTAPQDMMMKLDKFDFSRTASYAFTHTIGGSHKLSVQTAPVGIRNFLSESSSKNTLATSEPSLEQVLRTGTVALSDAVQALGLDVSPDSKSYPLRLDYITSSMGNLKESFLHNLFRAACGHAQVVSNKTSKTAKANGSKQQNNSQDFELSGSTFLADNLRIYFPSDQTVQKSTGGPRAAGTICFQSKWWDGSVASFPKELVADCVGVRRDGILMHSKVCLHFLTIFDCNALQSPWRDLSRGPTQKASTGTPPSPFQTSSLLEHGLKDYCTMIVYRLQGL